MKRKNTSSCSFPQRGRIICLHGDERGTVIPIVAVCLSVLIGFAAMVIDLGWLFVVRSELQNAADAGALAGVVELVQTGEDAARSTAVAYGTETDQFRLNVTPPAADAVNVTVLGPERLQVRISRAAGTTAGPIPTIFARIWGKETVEVRAVAVTTVNRGIIGTGPRNLLPFGIHVDMVDTNGDGLYDLGNTIDIFPHPWASGNFGILDLDGGSNSNADTVRWIENGYDGTFIIPEGAGDIIVEGSEHLNIEGSPGIVGNSIADAIYSRYGDRVLFPVFDQVSGNGANAKFRVIDFVGAIITGMNVTNAVGKRYLNIRIMEFSAPNIVIGGGGTPNNNSVSAPVLIQ